MKTKKKKKSRTRTRAGVSTTWQTKLSSTRTSEYEHYAYYKSAQFMESLLRGSFFFLYTHTLAHWPEKRSYNYWLTIPSTLPLKGAWGFEFPPRCKVIIERTIASKRNLTQPNLTRYSKQDRTVLVSRLHVTLMKWFSSHTGCTAGQFACA